MDLPGLADFHLVATHGGFGRASRMSGRPKATLSRRVSDLESSLGTRLIERGTRNLRLTEAGALLHARTGPLLNEIAEAGAAVAGGFDRPRGPLIVSAPVLLCDTALGAMAAHFLRTYPDVQLEIRAEDRFVDAIDEGVDVVIRVNPSPDERLVGRCVLRDERWLVAVPDLTKPAAGEDKPWSLPAVMRAPPVAGETWSIHDGMRRVLYEPTMSLRLSSLPMVRDAVAAGAGVALLPRSLVQSDVAAGRLACWGWIEGPPTEVWALHTSRRLVSPKVSAFVSDLGTFLRRFGT